MDLVRMEQCLCQALALQEHLLFAKVAVRLQWRPAQAHSALWPRRPPLWNLLHHPHLRHFPLLLKLSRNLLLRHHLLLHHHLH